MKHIIGDSHALCFADCVDVKPHWMGAATAFNLYKRNEEIQQIIRTEVRRTDDLYFLFGEIDCRIHIYNNSMRYGVHPQTLLTMTAKTYLTYLNESIHRNFYILFVNPQGYADNEYEYPYYTDRVVRQQYTTYFNAWLDYYTPMRAVNIWPEYDLWCENDFKEDKVHLKNEVIKHYWELSGR